MFSVCFSRSMSILEPLDLPLTNLRGTVRLILVKILVWYTSVGLLALASMGAMVFISYPKLLLLLSNEKRRTCIHQLVLKQRRGRKF